MKVDLNKVIEAVDYVSDSMPSFYVIPEERIITVSQGEAQKLPYDENDLIRLPDRRDVDDYGNMERFIERVEDETIKEWLSNAITGRGAFRMFRAALERFHMLNEWYDYRERCHRVLAMDWCEQNGIEYEGPRYVIEEEDDYEDEYDDGWDEPEEKPAVIVQASTAARNNFRKVDIGRKNISQLIFLASDYRDEQLMKRGKKKADDPDRAEAEMEAALAKGARITAVSENGRFLGYIAAVPSEGTVCVTEAYVRKEMRRRGIGTMLVANAAETARENGEKLVFSVAPDQNEMILLLAKLGFGTLSKLEISAGEEAETAENINVGSHRFSI